MYEIITQKNIINKNRIPFHKALSLWLICAFNDAEIKTAIPKRRDFSNKEKFL